MTTRTAKKPRRKSPAAGKSRSQGATRRGVQPCSSFEVYRDAADKWRWRCLGRNGVIIAIDGSGFDGYESRANCLRGLRALQAAAAVGVVTYAD